MPGFKTHGQFLVSYDAYKSHYSLFPASDEVVKGLGAEIEPHLAGSGTIRFKASAPIPVDLVRRIVEIRVRRERRSREGLTARWRRAVDFDAFDVLTFDCYGTLIDWESGLLAGLHAVLDPHGVDADRPGPARDLRRLRGRGRGRARTCAIATCWASACAASAIGYGVEPTDAEVATFGGSVADWPAFPDSAAALARLKTRYRLGVITNCDDDLFAASNRKLGVEFDWVITAEQARGYKPRIANFELAFERIDVPRERILHVAQSLFHDHVTAKALGMTTVWIDRRHDRPGPARPRRPTRRPDLVFPDMASFAAAATAG